MKALRGGSAGDERVHVHRELRESALPTRPRAPGSDCGGPSGLGERERGRCGTPVPRGPSQPGEAARFTGRSVAGARPHPPDDRRRRRDPVQVGIRGSKLEAVRGRRLQNRLRLRLRGGQEEAAAAEGGPGPSQGRSGGRCAAEREEFRADDRDPGPRLQNFRRLPPPDMDPRPRPAALCTGTGRRTSSGRAESRGRAGCGAFGEGGRLQERITRRALTLILDSHAHVRARDIKEQQQADPRPAQRGGGGSAGRPAAVPAGGSSVAACRHGPVRHADGAARRDGSPDAGASGGRAAAGRGGVAVPEGPRRKQADRAPEPLAARSPTGGARSRGCRGSCRIPTARVGKEGTGRRAMGASGAGNSGRGGPGRSRNCALQRGGRGRKTSGRGTRAGAPHGESCDGPTGKRVPEGGRGHAGHPAHRTAGSRHAAFRTAGGPAGRLPGSTVRRGLAHCRGVPRRSRARCWRFRRSAAAGELPHGMINPRPATAHRRRQEKGRAPEGCRTDLKTKRSGSA